MRRIESRQDHDELVAAEPRHGVRFAHRGGEPLRDRLQQLVARVVTERVVDPLEVIEVEEEARDVRAVALRLGEDLLQPLVEQRPVREAGEDVVLRELVRVRRRDLELVRALRDLLLERALVVLHFRLRFGQPLRHVVERVRERAELVRRARGHEHVELAGADRARRAHQPMHRRDQAARKEEGGADREPDQQRDDRECADEVLAELLLLPLEGHPEPDVAEQRRSRAAAGAAAPASAAGSGGP